MFKRVLIVLNRGTVLKSGTVAYGALRANLELAKSLQLHNCAVSFVCGAEQGLEEYCGIPVCACDARSTQSIRQVVRGQGAVDVIIENSNIEIFSEVLAPRQVVYMHNPHHPWGVETSGRALYEQVSAVVCVSEHSRRMNLRWGVPEAKLHVVPNGLDASVFNREKCSAPYPRRLIFVGQWIPDKGFDIALQVLEVLRQRYPDVELHAYGVNQVWKKHTEWLSGRGLLREDGRLDLGELNNAFPGLRLCGEVTQTALAQALREASILLHPSRLEETFGLISIEAQACGCIPVMSNLGAFPETLNASYTETSLAEAGQVESFVAKVSALLERSESELDAQREKMSQWVIERYSWSESCKRSRCLLEGLKPFGVRERLRFLCVNVLSRIRRGLTSSKS